VDAARTLGGAGQLGWMNGSLGMECVDW
jgi:hypothetical protein